MRSTGSAAKRAWTVAAATAIVVLALAGIALLALQSDGGDSDKAVHRALQASRERSEETSPTGPFYPPDALTVGLADAGRSVSIDVGEQLVVLIDGSTSIPYRWSVVAGAPGIIELTEETYESHGDALGSPGTFAFVFDAIEPGRTGLILEEVELGPEEDDSEPYPEQFVIEVVVRSGSE